VDFFIVISFSLRFTFILGCPPFFFLSIVFVCLKCGNKGAVPLHRLAGRAKLPATLDGDLSQCHHAPLFWLFDRRLSLLLSLILARRPTSSLNGRDDGRYCVFEVGSFNLFFCGGGLPSSFFFLFYAVAGVN
jgi:hypothetical protein